VELNSEPLEIQRRRFVAPEWTSFNFYLETHMENSENSLNELLEKETLAATIAANLRIIRDACNDLEDLDSLESQTAKIAANLRAIREDLTDLDELERQSDKIVWNLRSIQEP